MNSHQTSQGLQALISEVEASLALALDALEAFVLDRDGDRLRLCFDLCHQVRGCLTVAEDDGGALLAGEMEAVVDALRRGAAGNVGETCDALAQAIGRIPGCLRQRMAGRAAGLESLLPILNDLRAVRGEALFSESRVFAPALDILAVEGRAAAPVDEEDFCALLKKLRQLYQSTLLGMLRDGAPERHAAAFDKICARLRELCAGSPREQLWRVAGAFGEGLAQRRIPWSVASRMLLRDLDREVRFCAELGSRALGEPLPEALLVNLLYYIAISDAATPVISAVRADFRLDAALPGRREVTAGVGQQPSADGLADAVARGLAEEVDAIEEQLEASLASDPVGGVFLAEARRGLRRVADSLAMVSQPVVRERCEAIIAELDELIAGDAHPADVERLAVSIVDLESVIEGWRIDVAPRHDDRPVETRQALATVLEEVGRDLDAIKTLVLAYVEAGKDPAALVEAPRLAARLAAVLDLAGLDRWAAVMHRWSGCLEMRLAGPEANPAARDFDALADVIMAVEHALSDWLCGNRDADQMLLSIAEQNLDRLVAAPASPVASPAADAVAPGGGPSAGQGAAAGRADVDPDIRAVFVEESCDVLATLRGCYPRWRSNPADIAALGEVRRAFHTLKGSGRMVGADAVGDLAWALENLLNQVIEGGVLPAPAVLGCVGEAVGLLPAMVFAYERGDRDFDVGRVAALGLLADRLAGGETMVSAGSAAASGEAVDDATRAGGSDPDSDEDHRLLQIFARESGSHLEAVHQFVAAERARAPFYTPPTAALQGALHTLKGGAHMAGIEPLAGLVTALEGLIREMLDFQLAMEGDLVDTLADCADYAARVIVAGGDAAGDEVAHLLARIRGLRERVMARQGPAGGAHAVDPAFLHLVMAVGMVQVLDVEATLDAWLAADGFDNARFEGLAGELGELEAAALRAGFAPLATLAGSLAACYRAIAATPPHREQVATLLAAHEQLLAMVDAVAAHQQLLPAGEALLAGLARLAGAAAATVAAGPESRPPTEIPATLHEEVDKDIVALFLDEAGELLDAMEQDFQQWRETPGDGRHAAALKRSLHTFKGGARMAGLGGLGQACHELETAVVDAEQAIAGGDAAAFAALLDHHDTLVSGVAAARQALLAGDGHPGERAGDDGLDSGDRPPGAPVSAAILPFSGAHRGVDVPKPAGPGPQTVQELTKVAAPLLEALVNLAGEASVAHSQVAQHIDDFALALDEMDATIRRMHDQLRRLGVETDAQVMFRRGRVESSGGGEGFDPLEMDRYSQLQQLTRSLLESASDLQDLRDTLAEKSRDAESMLLQQSRINSDLQEGLMRTRMVPFSQLVPRLRRSARQVADELGKRVELRLDGVDGEMDRGILERIVPSLEHMIRNAVDHGIEDEERRRALGKPGPGTLSLSFAREGGDILIHLADDGRGLDVDAIRSRALASGLLDQRLEPSDLEIQHCIFSPGFSTSQSVTAISGRGVGMDVVNSDVRKLGGSISIDSRPGRGTRFTVRLPFTVSVNRALMVEAGGNTYALALNAIGGVARVAAEDLVRFYQDPEELFLHGGEQYRVRYLGSLLAADARPVIDSAAGRQLPVVLIRGQGRNYAVQVDALIGSREIVGKSLGAQFNRVAGLSGATVLGDGRVVVILDLQALLGDQPAVAGSMLPAAAAPVPAARCPTVMVVDDSVTVRKVTGRFLEREGLRVITARDGLDAMRMLQDQAPDLMVLDIEMPRMDGFEVVRLVRSTQRLKNLPIIMITSRSGEKHRERALSMGVDHYLGKPYQEELLIQVVRELLAGGSAVAGREAGR